jgi:hypothetical protein
MNLLIPAEKAMPGTSPVDILLQAPPAGIAAALLVILVGHLCGLWRSTLNANTIHVKSLAEISGAA